MKFHTTIIFFVFVNANISFAQNSYTEFEWQVLSWIRQSRLGLLMDIEIHEYNNQNLSFYNNNCNCMIDGMNMRNQLDSLIQETKYNFVKHIYIEMSAVVQKENMPCFDLISLWNNKLKELENSFLDTQSKKENEVGYISKKELNKLSLHKIKDEFRINVLNLYPYEQNGVTCLECLNNRWFNLIDIYVINDTERYYCSDFAHRLLNNDNSSQASATYGKRFSVKNNDQLATYLRDWVQYMYEIVRNYIKIIDNSRKNDLNKIQISIPLLKENISNYAQQSSFVFVQDIYQKLHDVLPNNDTIGKIDLLELWIKTILKEINELKTRTNSSKTCKELKSIKSTRHLYDILDIETSDKAKEDHEIKSVFLYLIEKSLLQK